MRGRDIHVNDWLEFRARVSPGGTRLIDTTNYFVPSGIISSSVSLAPLPVTPSPRMLWFGGVMALLVTTMAFPPERLSSKADWELWKTTYGKEYSSRSSVVCPGVV
ncbi:hypothetical protein COCON_G00126820 [Conger conger]|uniref:Uncharacterized protein n=1 Tax=Conger conger TaxID=82655 RepID=A0A9Q1DDP0_CONCO|nr:hypothetical protein COCON_G00126820 [Conger conger]